MSVSFEALASCPYCGSKASTQAGRYGYAIWIGCPKPTCPVKPSSQFHSYAEAFAAWNTRADPSQVTGVEEIAAAIDEHVKIEWVRLPGGGGHYGFVRKSLTKAAQGILAKLSQPQVMGEAVGYLIEWEVAGQLRRRVQSHLWFEPWIGRCAPRITPLYAAPLQLQGGEG